VSKVPSGQAHNAPAASRPDAQSSAAAWPHSLQLVGSKALGGAERWFIRFAAALGEAGAPADLGFRRGSDLDRLAPRDLGALPQHRLPFLSTWDPWSRLAVSRLIRDIRPEIVQTYMGRATRLTHLRPDPRGGRGPVHVARLGGYYRLDPYRHAHAWIGNTHGLCDWMVRQGLPASRVFHIYNFAEPARQVPAGEIAALRTDLALPVDAWALLAPGRFVPVKGHADLLEALALLPREIGGRPLRLILLGDGVLRPELERRAAQLGIADRLVWPGWRNDPGPFLRLADLVVFPSLEEETLGNVILDAWAWGRPLVTALFRGAREIARHGEDAWCVPCGDPKALAAGIRTLLNDPDLAAALTARGGQRVTAEFGRGPIMRQYCDLYRRLTGA
jgi:glycosyltransferase involved in cell wall biosynthesis